MTDVPARSDAVIERRHRITAATRECFLEAFKASGNVSAACLKANISRDYAYDLRKRDAAFAAAWAEAEQIATDALELEARRRAVEGVAKPLVSMGKLVRDDDGKVIEVRDYSDHLMLALLRGHRPERFREAALRVDVTFDIGSRLDTALRYRASAGRVIEGDSTATATAIEGEPTDT